VEGWSAALSPILSPEDVDAPIDKVKLATPECLSSDFDCAVASAEPAIFELDMLRQISELVSFLLQNGPDAANPSALITQPTSSDDLTNFAADAELGLHSLLI
jgi:hypothetical protein